MSEDERVQGNEQAVRAGDGPSQATGDAGDSGGGTKVGERTKVLPIQADGQGSDAGGGTKVGVKSKILAPSGATEEN